MSLVTQNPVIVSKCYSLKELYKMLGFCTYNSFVRSLGPQIVPLYRKNCKLLTPQEVKNICRAIGKTVIDS